MGYAIDTLDQIFQMIWLAMELFIWLIFVFMIINTLKTAIGDLIKINHFCKHIKNSKKGEQNG